MEEKNFNTSTSISKQSQYHDYLTLTFYPTLRATMLNTLQRLYYLSNHNYMGRCCYHPYFAEMKT